MIMSYGPNGGMLGFFNVANFIINYILLNLKDNYNS